MTIILPLLYAVGGVLVASVLSLVPALHIYNVAGFIVLATATLGEFAPPELLAMFFLGLITGYSFMNSISSIFLSAPDDSTVFVGISFTQIVRQFYSLRLSPA